jgi:uncharacterized membrane protein YcaP (DUF421 family)
MAEWLSTDWASIFLPTMSLPEILVRGALVYLALCLLIRVIPKRHAGRSSISDMLFVVLIAGIAVDGIAKKAESLPDFFLVLLTVFLWSFLLDWLAFRFPRLRPLIEEPPTCLIRDGRILQANLRRELVTEEELKAQLRRQDVDDLSKVKEALLEADGEISVVTKANGDTSGTAPTSPTEETSPCKDEPAPVAAHRLNGHRHPEPPAEDDEDELEAFLAAAERLEAKLAWHQQQAADHQARVAKFREALKRQSGGRKKATDGTRIKHG